VEDLGAVIAAAGGSAFVSVILGRVLALEATARGSASRSSRSTSRRSWSTTPVRRSPRTTSRGLEGSSGLASAGGGGLLHAGRPAVPEDMLAGCGARPMWAGMEALAHTLPYDGRVMGDTMFGRPLPAGRWSRSPSRRS